MGGRLGAGSAALVKFSKELTQLGVTLLWPCDLCDPGSEPASQQQRGFEVLTPYTLYVKPPHIEGLIPLHIDENQKHPPYLANARRL